MTDWLHEIKQAAKDGEAGATGWAGQHLSTQQIKRLIAEVGRLREALKNIQRASDQEACMMTPAWSLGAVHRHAKEILNAPGDPKQEGERPPEPTREDGLPPERAS